MKPLKPCGIYLRCSTALPSQMISNPEQLAAIEVDIARNGYRIEPAASYLDYARSGRSIYRRDGLAQLLKDAESGKLEELGVRTIMLWGVDRLARNLLDALSIQEKLAEYGIRLMFVREHMTVEGGHRKIGFVIGSLLAEHYSNTIASQNRRAHRRKAELGHYWAIDPPFGFRKNHEKATGPLEIEPLEAEQIALIYRLFLTGHSLRWIAAYLMRQRIPRRNGTFAWKPRDVKRILKHPENIGIRIYMGCIRIKGRAVSDPDQENWIIAPYAHDGIVSAADFIAAQRLFERKAAVRNYNTVRKHEWMLSGIDILKCGKCDWSYVGWTVHAKTKKDGSAYADYSYYVCTRQHQFVGHCDNKPIRQERLDAAVLGVLESYARNPDTIAAAWEKHRAALIENLAPAKKMLRAADKQLADNRRRQEKLVLAIENGRLPEDLIEKRLSVLQTEERQLLLKRRQWIEEIEAGGPNFDEKELLKLLANFRDNFNAMDIQSRKQLLCALIKRIEIHGRDSITVTVKFLPPAAAKLPVKIEKAHPARGGSCMRGVAYIGLGPRSESGPSAV